MYADGLTVDDTRFVVGGGGMAAVSVEVVMCVCWFSIEICY